MNETVMEVKLAAAQEDIRRLAQDVKDLEGEIRRVEKQEAARERARLLWGISALGTVVMTLGALIWNYRAVIFK